MLDFRRGLHVYSEKRDGLGSDHIGHLAPSLRSHCSCITGGGGGRQRGCGSGGSGGTLLLSFCFKCTQP